MIHPPRADAPAGLITGFGAGRAPDRHWGGEACKSPVRAMDWLGRGDMIATPLAQETRHAARRPVATIVTRDRARGEALYAGTLGPIQLPPADFAALFDLAGVTMRLTEVPDYRPTPHPVLGWKVADMERAVDALGAGGISFTVHEGMGQDARGIWTAPDGRAKVAFFTDANGNVLSLTQSG